MTAVEFEVDDAGVGVLTLRGTDRLNIFNLAMRDALIETLELAGHHPAMRALLLRGAGENFCAGADLREFGSARNLFDARWIRSRRDPWLVLWEFARPTVVALDGVAMGSGLEMALLCDFRLSSRKARLGLPEARLAMLPAAGGTQSLARVITPAATFPIVAFGTELTAERAFAAGIVHAIADDVQAEAYALALELAGLPERAAMAAKAALRSAVDLPLAEGLLAERRLAALASRRA